MDSMQSQRRRQLLGDRLLLWPGTSSETESPGGFDHVQRSRRWKPRQFYASRCFPADPDSKSQAAWGEKATGDYLKRYSATIEELEAFVPVAQKALAQGKSLPAFPLLRNPVGFENHQSMAMYNGMIHPLTSLAIRGALWSEGSGCRYAMEGYQKHLTLLIAGWREAWGYEFPFYFVQVPPSRASGDSMMLPVIRDCQAAVLAAVPNTGMAQTMDVGSLAENFPENKEPVGHRLALWALAKTYGQNGLVYCGPIYKSMGAEGNRIRIQFDHVGGGLVSRDGRSLTCFTITGTRSRVERFPRSH